MQARHAAAILEEEYPDTAERKKATAAARDAATPVPEKVWALRNVGSTLAMGGAREQARARQLLEKAVVLKQQWLSDPRHPGGASATARCSTSPEKGRLIRSFFKFARSLFMSALVLVIARAGPILHPAILYLLPFFLSPFLIPSFSANDHNHSKSSKQLQTFICRRNVH